jgi:hypothetical protein
LGQQDDDDDDDMDDAFWNDIEGTNESLFMLAQDESNRAIDHTERAALCQFPGCHRAVFVDPDTKQAYAYCGITHGKAHMLMLEGVTNELWPEDEAKPTSAPSNDKAVAPVPSPQPPPIVMSAPESRPGVLPVLPDKTNPVALQTVSEEAMTLYDVKPKPGIVPLSNAILSTINDTSKRLSFASSGSVTPLSIVTTPATASTRISNIGITPLEELQRHRRSTVTSTSIDHEQLARQQAERIAAMQLALDDASSSLSVAGTHIASQNTRIEQLCQSSLKVATIGLLESQGEAADERAAAQSSAAALRLSATIAEMSALREQHDQLQLRVGVGDGLIKSAAEQLEIERLSVAKLQHELTSSSKRIVSLEGAVSMTKKHVSTIAYIAKKAIGSSDRTSTIRRVLIVTAILSVFSRAFPHMAILIRTAIQQLLKSAVSLTASSAKSNFIFLISTIVNKIRVTMKPAAIALVGAALTRVQLALTVPAPVNVDEEMPDQSPPTSSVDEVAMPVTKTSRKGAALYDGGCTTLMTNNKSGLIGDLYNVQSATFNTAGVARSNTTPWDSTSAQSMEPKEEVFNSSKHGTTLPLFLSTSLVLMPCVKRMASSTLTLTRPLHPTRTSFSLSKTA